MGLIPSSHKPTVYKIFVCINFFWKKFAPKISQKFVHCTIIFCLSYLDHQTHIPEWETSRKWSKKGNFHPCMVGPSRVVVAFSSEGNNSCWHCQRTTGIDHYSLFTQLLPWMALKGTFQILFQVRLLSGIQIEHCAIWWRIFAKYSRSVQKYFQKSSSVQKNPPVFKIFVVCKIFPEKNPTLYQKFCDFLLNKQYLTTSGLRSES